jgi:hypothetical protein
MPCFDGREHRDDQHAAKAVPLLCAYCRELANSGIAPNKWPDGLPEWYREHQKIDREDGR